MWSKYCCEVNEKAIIRKPYNPIPNPLPDKTRNVKGTHTIKTASNKTRTSGKPRRQLAHQDILNKMNKMLKTNQKRTNIDK